MNRFNRRIIGALLVISFFLFFGTVVFHLSEGWSFVDSFYVTGITLATVGYGDVHPTHAFTKIFAVFLSFVGVGVVCYSIGIIAQRYVQQEVEGAVHKVWTNTKRTVKKEERELEHLWDKTKRTVVHEEQEIEHLLQRALHLSKQGKSRTLHSSGVGRKTVALRTPVKTSTPGKRKQMKKKS